MRCRSFRTAQVGARGCDIGIGIRVTIGSYADAVGRRSIPPTRSLDDRSGAQGVGITSGGRRARAIKLASPGVFGRRRAAQLWTSRDALAAAPSRSCIEWRLAVLLFVESQHAFSSGRASYRKTGAHFSASTLDIENDAVARLSLEQMLDGVVHLREREMLSLRQDVVPLGERQHLRKVDR